MAKIERTKNATRNIVFGVILKAYQILVPFLMRTAMIYLMGVQYLGLNSLFTSVLQVLNLAELGVGSAMIYSMYRPIAEDDDEKICALMKLYRTYYRAIGLVIAIVGCILTPFVPELISGEIPKGLNIYILYLLNLGATVLSYWLFAYKNSILQAHQRTDIVSKATLITSTIQYILQILVLWFFRNYYLYVIVMLITQAVTNIVTAVVADKLYPQFKPKGDIPNKEVKQINQRIKDLFTAKLGAVVIGSADTIVISAFLGLTTLAIYQNYYFILNSICGFITVIFSAITAGIGNSLVTESTEKNYNDFRKFTFIICFILCICCCCFAGLYQPFMRLWVGEKFMLDFSFVILFCILFYCLELAMVWATVKDAAGLWHSDRFRPLIGAIANLLMNVVLVQIIGLYGIILSTVFSYILISMPWLIHNLFKFLYKEPLIKYLKDLGFYILVAVGSTALTISLCRKIVIEGIVELIIKSIVSVSIPLVIECLVYRRKKEFIESVILIKKMLKKG
ncbi:lipopolysaccharide biosynthesis protein [Eubacterium ventriosum]|jgi:O-antigen/teichoic acid export membrane protein|uniref:lipopolysaccharide biosynthesis protein n=1 Tax=Eubacterium ventriosum TaxID=39496 RepID=UPI002673E34B|nr:oligosaccharide flippase family protein [Eubacterium ventriosum]